MRPNMNKVQTSILKGCGRLLERNCNIHFRETIDDNKYAVMSMLSN